MTTGVKGGIGQHGYPDEFKAVQNTSGVVTPASATTRLSTSIDMIAQLIGLVGAAWNNGIIGTHHGTHGTTDTFVGRVRFLSNAIVAGKSGSGGLKEIFHRRCNGAFAENPQLNRIDRADSCAFPAKGTFIFVPDNLPWQILYT
jgi:hypothetical protein